MSRSTERHQQEAPLLRQRFWEVYKKRPDTIRNYSKEFSKFCGKESGTSYRAFGDFVMGRSTLSPETFGLFEQWIQQEEKK